MRSALLALVAVFASACGSAAPPARVPAAAVEPGLAIELDAASRAKLSPAMATHVDSRYFVAGHYTPLVLRAERAISEAQRAELAALGGMHLWDVTTTPGDAGSVAAKASSVPTDAILVHVVAEQVAAVIALSWVTRVDVPGAYPAGPKLPAEVARRIDPHLLAALAALGPARPSRVKGIGKTAGCLDAARREALTAHGVVVQTARDAPDCAYALFTFEVATDHLVAVASLPWIVKLEASRPLHLEDQRRRNDTSE